MKITVITGSPHKNGSTALLAEQFIRGAEEAGHNIFRFNAAFETVALCLGCDRCGPGSAKCVYDDSMEKLNPHLLSSDMIVFVTPLYYFGMSAQLKTVIDRFYANNSKLMGNGRKAVLMFAAYDTEDWAVEALISHYKSILRYLKWDNAGIIAATGCGTRDDTERADYPARAYRMGKELD